MFENAKSFNGAISLWDVSKVTNMNFMFKGAESFHTDIDMWDVSKTTSMRNMFYLSPLEQNTPIWYKE
jgi:surface protein